MNSQVSPEGIGSGIVGMISAAIGLAIIAVILSKGAATTSVVSSFFSGLSSLVAVAVSPITGTNPSALVAAASGSAATGSGTYAAVSGFGFGNIGGTSTTGTNGTTVVGNGQNTIATSLGAISLSDSTLKNIGTGLDSLTGGNLFGTNSGNSSDPASYSVGGSVKSVADNLQLSGNANATWQDATGMDAWTS